jgi:hypothetical protein
MLVADPSDHADREALAGRACEAVAVYHCDDLIVIERGCQATDASNERIGIARKTGDDVFLPREFSKLGGEDKVLRALRGLVRDGRLVRLGYGVVSRLSGEPLLYARCCNPARRRDRG